MNSTESLVSDTDIAIVGMAGRFPGAPDVDAFWANVRDGVESIQSWSEEELRARGVPESVLRDPLHVRAGAPLPGVDLFDAGFFGYSPREAEEMDPQHRLFLETSWQALEHAGYDASAWERPIGVYGGVGVNTYLLTHLVPSGRFADFSDISSLQGLMNGNNKDSMTTTVAYKLNLRGPAVTVQTACSTSLAAVHVACRGLLNHEADMAVAGGVWINLLHRDGYRHQPGAILSSDGHCRAFDARATGTVIGSGVGIVVLKRLADALAEGDTVYAVVKGSAMNNDGSGKVGYTAPSVEGQAEVIAGAMAMADVEPRSIGYVEAHGTGTTMGDPIEVAALSRAFRFGTDARQYCAIGSVKTNIGHLDAAAGVAGLIKAAMALHHRTLPPSLHFEAPNPQIDFASSPFYVNTAARPWPTDTEPRRAGVSSFGIGGTNVHVVLEEAAPQVAPLHTERWRLLPVSARTPEALDLAIARLHDHLAVRPELAIADVAHTLQCGRKGFSHRAVAVVGDRNDALAALSRQDVARLVLGGTAVVERPAVIFLFPGQGSQHVDMARALYETEPVFRTEFDRCADSLEASLGLDLRKVVYPAAGDAGSGDRLAETALTQPALFAVSYATARLWMSWGVTPRAMLGHSIGEYVAACLAGVFSLDDTLRIVAARGRLLQALPGGAMLAVGLAEAELEPWLAHGCDLAAVNAPQNCVLSGSQEAIAAAERELAGRGVAVQRLHVSHAFHSALIEPACAALEALVGSVARNVPALPFLSNLTGRLITAEQATDPGYWSRHLRSTVRFADGLTELLRESGRVLLEVGPGDALSQLARRHPDAGRAVAIVSSQPNVRRCTETAADHLPLTAGRLWTVGVDLDWAALAHGAVCRRVPLPAYPFEQQSYWVGAAATLGVPEARVADLQRGLDAWFHVPSWRRAEPARPVVAPVGRVLVLGSADPDTAALVSSLQALGAETATAEAGGGFEAFGSDRYLIGAGNPVDAEQLLRATGRVDRIVHLWPAESAPVARSEAEIRRRGFFSLAALAHALDEVQPGVPVAIDIVTRGLADVTGDELLDPAQALLVGPCRVIPQECPAVTCRLIDLGSLTLTEAATRLAIETATGGLIAYRGAHRWLQTFVAVARPAPATSPWRDGGVYLITGGLGGIGFALAQHLVATAKARLVLAGRSAPDAAKAEAIARWRAAGAEVLVVQTDVSRSEAVAALVAQARDSFGTLHGVVHAAGAPGGGLVTEANEDRLQQVMEAKVGGLKALIAALGDAPLDFMLLCSSLSTIAGGLRKVDYVAANAFLDAAAHAAARTAVYPILSVNWDSWRDVGMAADISMPDGVGIRPNEGVLACERLLAAPVLPQVIVSTLDLSSRLEGAGGNLLTASMPDAADRGVGHPRPELATPYVHPDGELEQAIATLWQTMLGLDKVGRHDNFFELGGDSLLGIQLLSKVRSMWVIELHPASFFKQPTVEGLAQLVEGLLLDEISSDATQDLAGPIDAAQ
jgi:acyl transferase domain-containing protein